MKVPNSGSPEAVSLGCTCPMLDNGMGAGRMLPSGEIVFRQEENCPLHGNKMEK